MQGDFHAVGVDLGHHYQAASGQGLLQIHVRQHPVPVQRCGHLLAQAQEDQRGDPFLSVESGSVQHGFPASSQHNAVDIPAQGGLANGQGLQKAIPPPQGGNHPPYRAAVGGLGCDDRFHAVISFPALFRRGKVAGITI